MNIENNRISVLLSTYNNEKTIKDSIASILKQTYKNFELLIIDDGSEDNTLQICKSFSDSRIKLFKNDSNIGLTKSLNKVSQYATGKYLARQDGDDISLNNRLQKQIAVFNKLDNLDIVTSRAYIKNSNRIIPKYRNYISYKILINYLNPFIHGTLMIKNDSFIKLNRYNENFIYAQDYKLFYDAIKLNMKIKVISEPIYILNLENNISSNKREDQQYYANCVRKNLLP